MVCSYQIPSYSSGATPGGYDAAGNIVGYSDSVNGTYGALNGTAGFGYDTLNRLISAAGKTAANTTSFNCWAYDAFGNRTTSYAGPCSDNPAPTAAYYANNRIQSGLVTYDAAGDVTMNSASGGANQYLYDAEGRVCAVQSQAADGVIVMDGYVYDASGARVAKGVISVWSCDPSANGLRTTVDYILGPGGQTATELGDNGKGAMVWQRSYVYAGGQNIAVYDDNGLHFRLTDWLGTLRATTDSAGVVESTCSSLPFGDGQACNGPTDTHHFTGKERDTESGNDYFGARYYSSALARWLSPDWSAKVEPVPYAKLDNPQTLNLYAYVGNNPLGGVDADGHDGPDHAEVRAVSAKAAFANGVASTTVVPLWYAVHDFPGTVKGAALTIFNAFAHPNDTSYQLRKFEDRVLSGDAHALGQLTGLGIAAWLTGGGPKSGTMETGLEEIAEIGGRTPINAKYAGGVHPSGVGFTPQGYPNFSSFADYQVEVKGLTGNYAIDAGMANRAAGLKGTPKGYVWHHVEDGRTMQLIPRSVHRTVGHSGGASIIKKGAAGKK